jgi:hypothetical protein
MPDEFAVFKLCRELESSTTHQSLRGRTIIFQPEEILKYTNEKRHVL